MKNTAKRLSDLKLGDKFILLDDADIKTYTYLGKGDALSYSYMDNETSMISEIQNNRRISKIKGS